MDCGICMERDDREIVATECGHMFHRHCVDRWLSEHGTCPTCRRPSSADVLRRLFVHLSSNGNGSHPQDIGRAVCKCTDCHEPHAGKLWCPLHVRCTAMCRTAVAGLCVLQPELNGQLYCQNCCAVRCTYCGRFIANTGVRWSARQIFHAGCFPCRVCGRPLHSGGYDLHLKTNRFHARCLRCARCGRRLRAGCCRFRGYRPYCRMGSCFP